ncbi:uncharacterized protein Z518_00182 [Rhinocladiella mackenziei CBS 650.93]|uniref:Myb/SANT-like DNA-binding domain-containing protein n=1 Tax=Rhinocladiella mackenziei CBS 650.93 TaxID=1442369 RepID=A0A0D2ISX8_9EURO|nr:uncharacterized protein Z518_00182 [Rhinocladiella mackenziei CBS 650.93]KIX09104.1 hypothetical protein Z518_00182 [Rhinocladiella mackenziei CBS 650.93]
MEEELLLEAQTSRPPADHRASESNAESIRLSSVHQEELIEDQLFWAILNHEKICQQVTDLTKISESLTENVRVLRREYNESFADIKRVALKIIRGNGNDDEPSAPDHDPQPDTAREKGAPSMGDHERQANVQNGSNHIVEEVDPTELIEVSHGKRIDIPWQPATPNTGTKSTSIPKSGNERLQPRVEEEDSCIDIDQATQPDSADDHASESFATSDEPTDINDVGSCLVYDTTAFDFSNSGLDSDSSATEHRDDDKQSQVLPTSPTPPGDSTKRPPKRWTDEEEDCMISIVRTLMNQLGNKTPKKTMWELASVELKKKGFNRRPVDMMARWSANTRTKLEKMGPGWYSQVMKKRPRVERTSGLRAQSGESEELGTICPRAKRTKFTKRQPNHNDTDAPTGDHTQDSRRVNGSQDQPRLHLKRGHGPLRLRLTWGRASGGMEDLDWSPDGTRFVASSRTLVNDDPEQNYPRNLLLGSVTEQTIKELPGHREERFDQLTQGRRRHTYYTVCAVRWAKGGDRMVSAGFDGMVRVWDVQDDSKIRCTARIPHLEPVAVMDLSVGNNNLLATSTEKTGADSIRVWRSDSDFDHWKTDIRPLQGHVQNFAGSPMALQFGKSHGFQNWLIAGFAEDGPNGYPSRKGYLGVWRFDEAGHARIPFSPEDASVFDVAWSATDGIFAAGIVRDPESRKDMSESSVVKLYSTTNLQAVAEFSCPALDMNDVTICPYQENYVTASCTNGSTYVWDQRLPREPIHILSHGPSVSTREPGQDRELTDVGVRFTEWSGENDQLYTGGHDGRLKQWDVRRSPEDALVRDVDSVGIEIMCGHFSPDRSSLLIGDDGGCLHLYSKSRVQFRVEEFEFEETHW